MPYTHQQVIASSPPLCAEFDLWAYVAHPGDPRGDAAHYSPLLIDDDHILVRGYIDDVPNAWMIHGPDVTDHGIFKIPASAIIRYDTQDEYVAFNAPPSA